MRLKPDFESGVVAVTQLNTEKTRFPERDDLVMDTANDFCLLKHRESVILSSSLGYRLDFPPTYIDASQKFKKYRTSCDAPPVKRSARGVVDSIQPDSKESGDESERDSGPPKLDGMHRFRRSVHLQEKILIPTTAWVKM